MIYVMAGIHGEFDAYEKMLKKIKFSDEDDLYILGNCIDHGPEPIKVLQDMMLRPNVYPIIGEHEYVAYRILSKLTKVLASGENNLDKEMMAKLRSWQEDGGEVTLEQFQSLDEDERLFILEYLEEFEPYDIVTVGKKEYILVHAGLDNFSPDRELDDYSIEELIFKPVDYSKVYFKDKYLVTGHTPTVLQPGNTGKIIVKNRHIAIDCGKVFGGKLACICLDTKKVYYV